MTLNESQVVFTTQHVLDLFSIPSEALTDINAVLGNIMGKAKERNPTVAVLLASRAVAETIARYQMGHPCQYLDGVKKFMDEMMREFFARNYTVKPGIFDGVTAEQCVRTMLRLVNGCRDHSSGMAEGAYKAFPCKELIRVYTTDDEVSALAYWKKRWLENGGTLFKDRMIALKDDKIWNAISDFDLPYPPFRFNSCMGVLDVGRRECIELGIIKDRPCVEQSIRFSLISESCICKKAILLPHSLIEFSDQTHIVGLIIQLRQQQDLRWKRRTMENVRRMHILRRC